MERERRTSIAKSNICPNIVIFKNFVTASQKTDFIYFTKANTIYELHENCMVHILTNMLQKVETGDDTEFKVTAPDWG
jgi:hypothetical protein